MAFENKYYTRRLLVTLEVIEVWESTSGKPEYIVKDGQLRYFKELNKVEKVTEPFREMSDFEVMLLKAQEG